MPDQNNLLLASGLLDLTELQLHGRGTTENRDRHAQLVAFVVDFFDGAVEVGEGTFLDADVLTHLEFHLVAGFVGPS